VTYYLTTWEKATPVNNCSTKTTTYFLFEQAITRFGCSKILMSDQGTHFINITIKDMTEEFEVYHQKSTPYHPQANGTVEVVGPWPSFEETLVVFDHFWDFDRLFEDGALRWSGDRGISLVLQACGPKKGFLGFM
jgi:hypothetical protein